MIGILIFTITALILGTLLVLTDNHFKKEDDKIEQNLPGYNCGVCGFGSCAGMKEAILENPENYKKCKLLKNQEAIKYFESLKNKGFTLVELLAVIIIIGVLALVTIPKVKDSLENSKKTTAVTSTIGYTKAIDEYALHQEMEKNNIKLNGIYNINNNGKLYNNLEEYEFEYDGKKPKNGILVYQDNELVSGCVTIDKYKVTITNGEVANTEKGTCQFTSVENRIMALADDYIEEFKETTITSSGLYYVSNINNEVSIEENPTDGWIKILYKETGEITILQYSLKFGNMVVNYTNSTKSLATQLAQTPEIECPDPSCTKNSYMWGLSTELLNDNQYICNIYNNEKYCLRINVDERSSSMRPVFSRNKEILDRLFDCDYDNEENYVCNAQIGDTSVRYFNIINTIKKDGYAKIHMIEYGPTGIAGSDAYCVSTSSSYACYAGGPEL